MRKFSLTCAACAVAVAGTAFATEGEPDLSFGDAIAERRIDIKGGVFFPPMTLAAAGETIVIRNDEDTVHDAVAIDGTWTTGPIQPGEQTVIDVVADMQMCFQSSYNEQYKGAFGDPETGAAPECFELSGAGDGENVNQN